MQWASVIPRLGSARESRRLGGRLTATMLADVLVVWLERARERRALCRLDDHLLKDIGLSRADIEREGGKPFWRP